MEPWRPPIRQTENLHLGRISLRGAQYFITMVTQQRKPWLGETESREIALSALRTWNSENQGEILAATIMPDHIHVLFALNSALTVGQTVARWKSTIRKEIGYTEGFQRDFWEHLVRPVEEVENYALYVFLNPYRAGLLPYDRPWPGWWSPKAELFKFTAMLIAGEMPPPEWIDWPEERFIGLAHGE